MTLKPPELNLTETRNRVESDQYQTGINETCAMRARTRGALSRFLIDNRLGQLLTQIGVFTHPTLKEKDLREEAIRTLAGLFQEVDPDLTEPDARLLVLGERDFQPKKPQEVVLEIQIEHRLFWGKLLNQHQEYPYNKLAECYDLKARDFEQPEDYKSEENRHQFAELFERVLQEKEYVFIRDECLKKIKEGDWASLIGFVFQNYPDPPITPLIREFFGNWGHRIFKQEGFRSQLVNYMINLLVTDGQQNFDQFDAFLSSLGLDLSASKEKAALSDAEFPSAAMENLWLRNREDFFRVIEKLYCIGLLSEQYQAKAELQRKFVEYTLLALHGMADHQFFVRHLRPLAASLEMFDESQLRLSERHVLYGAYVDAGMLCGKQPLPELREIYRRRRKTEDI